MTLAVTSFLPLQIPIPHIVTKIITTIYHRNRHNELIS